MRFSRRRALAGLAAAPATLAFARGLHATTAPKRLVIFMQNNGTQQANFWPQPGMPFTSPILEPILKHPAIAARTTLVKGVHMPIDANGSSANEHDQGFARMLTGERLLNIAGKPWGGGASVDQILARTWGPSVTLAVLTSQSEPHTKPGYEHRRSFSYVAPGVHKLPTIDPYVAYQQVFEGAAADDPTGLDARRRLALRRSVLDAVTGNLRDLSARLPRAERAKLEQHTSSVRELETRLATAIANEERRRTSGQEPSQCARVPKVPRHFSRMAPAQLLNDESAIPELVSNMVDLGAAALTCGVTRIATIQFGYGGGKWNFAWEGIDIQFHDDIAHKDTSDAGSDPLNTERIVKANRYFAGEVARMALALDAVPEGDGTMLDNTLILWANELGRGDHKLVNIPVVLIGKAGGALKPGGRVIDDGPQIFNRIGCSVLNLLGEPAAGFGDAPMCGPFTGL